MDDHLSELRNRLDAAEANEAQAERNAIEAKQIVLSLRAQVAAASSQRRHRRPLRPLLLLPGLVAGGVTLAKDAMASAGTTIVGHKVATAGTLTAAAVATTGTLVITSPLPEPHHRAPITSAADPATIVRPAPSRAIRPSPRRSTENGQTRRAPITHRSADLTPVRHDASSDPADRHDAINDTADAIPATPQCIRVELGPLGQIKLMCKGR